MGRTKLRRIFSQEQKWVDKNAPRHKHNYVIKAVMRLRHGDTGRLTYYNVMKCDQCSSFRSIPAPGTIQGLISDQSDVDMTLPVVRLYTPHKCLIEWTGAVLESDQG